jgi:hypothetical protein
VLFTANFIQNNTKLLIERASRLPDPVRETALVALNSCMTLERLSSDAARRDMVQHARTLVERIIDAVLHKFGVKMQWRVDLAARINAIPNAGKIRDVTQAMHRICELGDSAEPISVYDVMTVVNQLTAVMFWAVSQLQ